MNDTKKEITEILKTTVRKFVCSTLLGSDDVTKNMASELCVIFYKLLENSNREELAAVLYLSSCTIPEVLVTFTYYPPRREELPALIKELADSENYKKLLQYVDYTSSLAANKTLFVLGGFGEKTEIFEA